MKNLNAFLYPFLLISLVLLHTHAGFAAEPTLIASSGPDHVELLELYSSESCSSCPVADQWVSQLKEKKDLWKRFVPVVFHVNYWNHLGWKDNLSSQAMTNRQAEIAKRWEQPSVYTPGMVLDGTEWRNWRNSNTPEIKNDKKNNIALRVFKLSENEFRVKIDGPRKNRKQVVRVAILGMNLNSLITSGENAGRHLIHNFVVLDWDSKSLSSGINDLTFKLKSAPANGKAIAAWIEDEDSPTPLQATGGFL